MKISIIHPSRSRPDQARNTRQDWLSRADSPDSINYQIVCDSDDPFLFQYREKIDNLIICDNKNHSCITAINYGASLGNWDLIIVVSDDMDCQAHWDTKLIESLQGKEDYCVFVNDGKQPFIMTLPIMDRKYYERFGYIYNPEYRHMFADTEMSCVAWMLGKYLPVDISFTHRHYSYGLSEKDAVNVKNDSTWQQGEQLFKQHRRINFGLPLADIVNKDLPENSGLNNPRYM